MAYFCITILSCHPSLFHDTRQHTEPLLTRASHIAPQHSVQVSLCCLPEGQRFYPTSPLKEYPGSSVRRRRSHSASVRFKDTKLSTEDVSERPPQESLLSITAGRPLVFRSSQEPPQEAALYQRLYFLDVSVIRRYYAV